MEIAVVILGIIVIALLVERYYYAKETGKLIDRATKAVMSRNINEYMAATAIDKVEPQIESDPDEVFLNETDDETFDKHIKEQVK